MRRFLLSICLLCTCAVASAHTQTIDVLCPAASAIHFRLQHPGEKWHEYKDEGDMQVVSGDFPERAMEGQGSSTQALSFVGSTWTEGVFMCLYKGNHDDVMVSYDYFPSQFKQCRFVTGDPYNCDGSHPAQCELECSKQLPTIA
jgi:hypothetical protein